MWEWSVCTVCKCVFILSLSDWQHPRQPRNDRGINKQCLVHRIQTKRWTCGRRLGDHGEMNVIESFTWAKIHVEPQQENNTTKFCRTGFCVIYTAENLNSSVSCLFVCICLCSDPWRNKSFWVNQWNFSLLALLPHQPKPALHENGGID